MRIVIAGGGTGGHLFPGIAIAQEFMEKNSDNRVLFVSTGKPFEISVLAETGFAHNRIPSEGIKGRSWWRKMIALVKVPRGIVASIGILRRFKPDLVVGVGGYSAGPVAVAAWLLHKPIVLHEQNLLPGITNRMLAPLADRIYASFQQTSEFFSAKKVRIFGNPVRREIREFGSSLASENGAPTPFTVLIVGGSQGAHGINMAMMDAVAHMGDRDRFFIVHQTGTADEASVREAYRKQGVSGTVQAFFMDMATQFQKADLVICRAGATTVAEITAMGKPAIYIPFPYAADNHQVLNAESLVKVGAAEMIQEKDLTGAGLAERIDQYRNRPEALEQMAKAAAAHGKPDAAADIVRDCYALVRGADVL
jgi:UDP-N-acetylglucosamine--N-acetylmuramyl-(pentapeptide) pyrophosphoryl-undecaprenol N-acetylglucosamine transferase